nr:hypothetical protein [Tanacetum cinerariifolium]
MLPIKLTNDEIRNTKAYKEYYACATGEAAPKPKASARRKMSGSDTSITPPTTTTTPTTTVIVTSRLTAAAKGKQPAKAKSPSDPSEMKKLVLNQGFRMYPLMIQKKNSHGTLRMIKILMLKKRKEMTMKEMREERESDEESDGDETREDKSFNPIPRTPEDSEDDGNDEEDQGMESIFATASSPMAPLQTSTPIMTPSTIATITNISHAPIPPTTIPSEVLQNLPTFESVFRFEDRLKSLEANFSEYIQTNPFSEAVSNISGIVHQYMNQQMTEAVQRIIKEQVKSQVKEQVSRILPRIEQSVNAQLKAEVLTRSSHSSRTSYVVTTNLSEMELKKILIENMEGNKSIQCSDEQRNLYKALVDAYEADKTILDSYGDTVILKRRRDDDDDQEEGPFARSDRGSKRRREGKEPESASAPLVTTTRSVGRSTTGSKSRQVSACDSAFAEEPVQTTCQMDEPSYPVFETGSTQAWISELEKQADSRSSFNELLDTTLDFSNFIMNRLRVDTLTPELLTGPTFELMKGSCTSLIELEYHLEEVYKATTDQFDWVNLEGQQYPHNLLQTLPLIPDNQGRRVFPLHTSSTTTSSIFGEKRQQFYGLAINWESALDVYSKRRIIVVTDLKIVEWHSYKHLDWIMVRHDDDKLYKFKEGDLKRMFTRSIVIQRRVKDL